MTNPLQTFLLLLATASLLSLAACGDDDDAQDPNGDDSNHGDDTCQIDDSADQTTFVCPGVDSPSIRIELTWSHPDWEPEFTNDPDLDLHYCNDSATEFNESAVDHCISWINRAQDWEMAGNTQTVELDLDSLNPDDPERITHDAFTGGQTHLAVHYFSVDDEPDDRFNDVQAQLTITVEDTTWIDESITLGHPLDLWYAGIIDWSDDGASFRPGPPCGDAADDHCSSELFYDDLPMPLTTD